MEREEAHQVRDDLHELNRTHRYREAADLGDRVQHCGHATLIEPAVWAEIALLRAEACRHQGRYSDATTLGHEIWNKVKALGSLASDDEEATAAAQYAASLFDNHQFLDIVPVLDEWAAAATAAPRRFKPLTRVMVWNTLARGMAVVGRPEWRELFRRSLQLQKDLGDGANARRTLSYLVHALSRHGDVREAQTELAGVGSEALDPWSAFMVANVARCADDLWEYSPLDRMLDQETCATNHPHHAVAFYFQATARQSRRTRAEAVARFRCAARFMRAEAGEEEANICTLFAHFLDLAAAASGDDVPGWQTSSQRIQKLLRSPSAAPLRNYYQLVVDPLGRAPNLAAAEYLLRHVPYF